MQDLSSGMQQMALAPGEDDQRTNWQDLPDDMQILVIRTALGCAFTVETLTQNYCSGSGHHEERSVPVGTLQSHDSMLQHLHRFLRLSLAEDEGL